jgi:hypothetical protein
MPFVLVWLESDFIHTMVNLRMIWTSTIDRKICVEILLFIITKNTPFEDAVKQLNVGRECYNDSLFA